MTYAFIKTFIIETKNLETKYLKYIQNYEKKIIYLKIYSKRKFFFSRIIINFFKNLEFLPLMVYYYRLFFKKNYEIT